MWAYTEFMTVLGARSAPHRLPTAIRTARRALPLVGCGLPASALGNPAVAGWVRGHGLVVAVADGGDLDLVRASGVCPTHVVLRCGDAGTIRRAAASGVQRFVVSEDRHVDVLAGCPASNKHIYVDDRGPAVIGERRLDIVGMHCDVADSDGSAEWGAAAERLLSRLALMRRCGMAPARISLGGGPVGMWLAGGGRQLVAIASAVDDALEEGCVRWRLPRPAVTLMPLGR